MAPTRALVTPHSVFLRDGLPARLGAGRHVITLSFADTVYRFEGLSRSQRDVALGRFEPLVIADTLDPAILTRVWRADVAAFQPRPPRAWDYELAISYGPSDLRVSGLEFTATVDREPLGAELITSNDDQEFLGPFENLLRVLVVYRLLAQGALVLHSAAITDEEHGFLLFGRSGAGKTTICRLSQPLGLRVLSDELNALWPTNGGFALRPMPFAGDFGDAAISVAPSPLTGIYALEKAAEPKTRPCGSAEAIARMIAACPYANADPYIGDTLVERIALLQGQYPLRVLEFAKDPRFWGIINDERRA